MTPVDRQLELRFKPSARTAQAGDPFIRGARGAVRASAMRHWLMKSEPDEFSIDALAKAKGRSTSWFGVRNYQARNYMRDDMQPGDLAFFYHSSCPEPGIAGIVEVSRPAHPDITQFDAKSPYYDPKATRDNPRWFNVDVTLKEKTPLISLAALRTEKALKDMVLLRLGNRLSITPVTGAEWAHIVRMAAKGAQKPARS